MSDAEAVKTPAKSYTPPSWAGEVKHKFGLEMLKEGSTLENIDLSTKSYFIVGRTGRECDIHLQHPSISRLHAVFQHNDRG